MNKKRPTINTRKHAKRQRRQEREQAIQDRTRELRGNLLMRAVHSC